jgi:hypothetical protein
MMVLLSFNLMASIRLQATPTPTTQDPAPTSDSVPNVNSDPNFGMGPYHPTVSFSFGTPSDPFFPGENGAESMGTATASGEDMLDWSTFLTGPNNLQDDQQFMELLRWTLPEFDAQEGNT